LDKKNSIRNFFHLLDKGFHIPWERGAKRKAGTISSPGGQGKLHGVKAEPREKGVFVARIAAPVFFNRRQQHGTAPAVQRIAHHRETQRRRVNTYLVGSACFRQGLQHAVIAGTAQKHKTGDGFFPSEFIDDGHVPFVAVGNQGEIAGGFLPGRSPVDDGNVPFCNSPPLEGKGKPAVAGLVFREQHKAGGIAVYAVNDKDFSGNPEGFRDKSVQPFPGFVPTIGAHSNPGGLVDGDNFPVLVNDAEKRSWFHGLELYRKLISSAIPV